MNKQGQSLIDFISYLPLQAIQLPRAPVTNKEAQTLYQLWDGKRDEYGNIVVPNDINTTHLASLTSKGFLESKPSMASILTGNNRVVQITKKGKEIIKHIVLYTEKSTFEKKSGKEVDYEAIYLSQKNNMPKSGQKIAQWNYSYNDFTDENVRRFHSWLIEAEQATEAMLNRMKMIQETNPDITMPELRQLFSYEIQMMANFEKF